MRNTKKRILTTARELFNQKGYSEVTIRMIAKAAGMSSGNLNYHFQRREDILEGLYFEMVAVFDDRVERLGDSDISLQSMYEDIYQSLKRMLDYRFFWTDLYNLLRQNNNIKRHFAEAYHKRYKGYEFLFGHFYEKGLMLQFEHEKEGEMLIQRMIDISNTWLYNSVIYDMDTDEERIIHQTRNLILMLYPYFTAEGKKAYQKLAKDVFQ